MMNLQQYLSGEYQGAQQRLQQIGKQAALAVETLSATCSSGVVPYHIPKSSKPNYSHSTHAMVLHALTFLVGILEKSVISAGKPSHFVELEFSEKKEDDIKEVITSLATKLQEEIFKDGAFETKSHTYGINDPLTISWLVDIEKNTDYFHDIGDRIEKVAKAVVQRSSESIFFDEGEMQINKNAFPVLRQCLIGKGLGVDIGDKKSYFIDNLHRHLSLAAIPDSRFDPAELVFSVEGALQIDDTSIDSNTLERVVEVLKASQEKSAYWRPVTPMLFTVRGAALYPLSIEVANSLLRICQIKDREKRYDRLFSHIEPMLERYYDWLSAQMVTVMYEDRRYSGWHSENISSGNRIDVWETSQVLIFLQSYGAMLSEQMACESLIASGLKFSKSSRKKEDEDLSRTDYWKRKVRDVMEPFNKKGYKIYNDILNDYIIPREKIGKNQSKSPCCSMVLYGPPGTGKSSIPEELGNCLNWPLVTVTISDFFADGGVQTEQRAKALFQVLEDQRDVIILFDEIDHFILDRESKIYREQDSIFQFMPPGMLTKLRDLRRKAKSIFVVATNYIERIDSAAVRIGRIDNKYLVMPPDFSARHRIFEKLAKEKIERDKEFVELLQKTSFFIFNEISVLWNSIKINKEGSVKEKVKLMLECVEDFLPSTSLSSYQSRFRGNSEVEALSNKFPYKEFLSLVCMKYIDNAKKNIKIERADAELIKTVYHDLPSLDNVKREVGREMSEKVFGVLKRAAEKS